jgi:hypothetical protein
MESVMIDKVFYLPSFNEANTDKTVGADGKQYVTEAEFKAAVKKNLEATYPKPAPDATKRQKAKLEKKRKSDFLNQSILASFAFEYGNESKLTEEDKKGLSEEEYSALLRKFGESNFSLDKSIDVNVKKYCYVFSMGGMGCGTPPKGAQP